MRVEIKTNKKFSEFNTSELKVFNIINLESEFKIKSKLLKKSIKYIFNCDLVEINKQDHQIISFIKNEPTKQLQFSINLSCITYLKK